MGGQAFMQKRFEPNSILPCRERLVRVGPSIGLDGGGFASPDELCAAQAEVSPAAERVRRRGAISIGVPAFHRMDAPAIAQVEWSDVNRRGKWRAFGCG